MHIVSFALYWISVIHEVNFKDWTSRPIGVWRYMSSRKICRHYLNLFAFLIYYYYYCNSNILIVIDVRQKNEWDLVDDRYIIAYIA